MTLPSTQDHGSVSSCCCSFQVGNHETFPQVEGGCDLITATFVISWIKDKDLAFRNIYKALKPGGQFAVLTHENDGSQPPTKQLFEAMKDPSIMTRV